MKPLHPHEQPLQRRKDTSYYNPQIKEKEDSADNRTYRVRGTIGGDRINYPGETSASTAAMPVVKILLQSVISDDSNWMTLDIKDYYLNTPLARPEYIRIQRKLIPLSTMVQHELEQFMSNNSILFEVNQGMYGLPQAGYLAQQKLIEHLRKHQYHQTDTPCLFRHSSNGTTFALVVDDFGVKYTDKAAAQHLIEALKEIYDIKIDWTGAKYIGFTIQFNRLLKTVTLSMPAQNMFEDFNEELQETQGQPGCTDYLYIGARALRTRASTRCSIAINIHSPVVRCTHSVAHSGHIKSFNPSSCKKNSRDCRIIALLCKRRRHYTSTHSKPARFIAIVPYPTS